MHEIVIPQEDVNSETARLVEWHAERGAPVTSGQVVLTVETSKAVFDVEAPIAGFFVPLYRAGADVPFNVPVGYVVENEAELARLENQPRASSPPSETKATKKARQLALQYGIDLSAIKAAGIIREKDVEQFLVTSGSMGKEEDLVLSMAGQIPRGLERVIILGSGLGAMQVIDIILNSSSQTVAGFVDDDESMQGQSILGFPVLGTSKDIERLWRDKRFDTAICSISTNIPVRKRLYELCRSAGVPLTNAIDPSVRVNRLSKLGKGNVICSFVHIGTCAVLGDNNFISAHCNIEHHNVWGSHITTGPGVMTSSRVKVGNEVKMGTGVFIQPGVGIGEGCQIASGAVIIRSIPARHAVKTRIDLEIVNLEAS